MLKCVYLAPDEFTAITIKAMLKGKNIPAEIKRFETSWLDGLAKVMRGAWGEILVSEDDLKEAEEYIKEFLQDVIE